MKTNYSPEDFGPQPLRLSPFKAAQIANALLPAIKEAWLAERGEGLNELCLCKVSESCPRHSHSEIERLRAEIDKLHLERSDNVEELHQLRARLHQQTTLLREAREMIAFSLSNTHSEELIAKIDAALGEEK